MMKIFYSLLLCTFFIACVSNKKSETVNQVNLDSLRTKSITKNTFIKSVKYLPLETNDQCFIKNASGIEKVGDKIYILDILQKTIFIFNDKGDFVNKIANYGKGPGQYEYITDFFVANNKINILNSGRRIYTYDSDGQYISDTKLPVIADLFEYLDESKIILQGVSEKGVLKYLLAVYDLNQQKIIDSVPYIEGVNDIHPCFMKNIYKSKNCSYFNMDLYNTVYEIDSEGIKPLFTFESECFPTLEQRKQHTQNTELPLIGKTTGLLGIYEDDEFLTFSFSGSMLPYQVVYSKADGQYKCYEKSKYCSKLGRYFTGVDNDTFISFIIPSGFDGKAFFELLETDKTLSFIGNHKQQFETLKQEANPVIVLIDL